MVCTLYLTLVKTRQIGKIFTHSKPADMLICHEEEEKTDIYLSSSFDSSDKRLYAILQTIPK